MSLSTVRAELAAAVSDVDGIRACAPYFNANSSLNPRMAWVELHAVETIGFGAVDWVVVVALGQTIRDADRLADELLDPVLEALQPHLSVTRVDVGTINVTGQSPTTGGSVTVLQFRGRRER
jgi:hypothetical protein